MTVNELIAQLQALKSPGCPVMIAQRLGDQPHLAGLVYRVQTANNPTPLIIITVHHEG